MTNGPSWKWMVAILLGLTFAGIGYDYREIHRHIEENAIASTKNQVEIAQEHVRNEVTFSSLEKRLVRIEATVDRIEATVNVLNGKRFR